MYIAGISTELSWEILAFGSTWPWAPRHWKFMYSPSCIPSEICLRKDPTSPYLTWDSVSYQDVIPDQPPESRTEPELCARRSWLGCGCWWGAGCATSLRSQLGRGWAYRSSRMEAKGQSRCLQRSASCGWGCDHWWRGPRNLGRQAPSLAEGFWKLVAASSHKWECAWARSLGSGHSWLSLCTPWSSLGLCRQQDQSCTCGPRQWLPRSCPSHLPAVWHMFLFHGL